MKTAIHPKYYEEVQVTCVCGNKFTTGSTIPAINTEICSNCHPYYTGKKKFVDAGGRVDRFKKLAERAAETKATKDAVAEKRAAKAAADKKAADQAEKATQAAEAVKAEKAAKAAEAA